tara:strand:- start:847 stop:1515 length:669 start_codon:yes stop_codon:yes gene_type:complete
MSKQDYAQKCKLFFIFIFELYKILTSSLLVVLVPQKCNNGERMCSFSENFENLDPYNSFALYYNFFTSICFLLYYLVEIYRERLFIRLLDVDAELSKEDYDDEMEEYPKINTRVKEINELFYYINIFLIGILLSNIIVSIVVLSRFYLNDLTIFISISNTMLIADKQFKSFFVARKSFKENKAYSMYMTKMITYNTVDDDIKKKRMKRVRRAQRKLERTEDL